MLNAEFGIDNVESSFMISRDHLSDLKNSSKTEKGQRMDKHSKKALKLFRKNRQNKRNAL